MAVPTIQNSHRKAWESKKDFEALIDEMEMYMPLDGLKEIMVLMGE